MNVTIWRTVLDGQDRAFALEVAGYLRDGYLKLEDDLPWESWDSYQIFLEGRLTAFMPHLSAWFRTPISAQALSQSLVEELRRFAERSGMTFEDFVAYVCRVGTDSGLALLARSVSAALRALNSNTGGLCRTNKRLQISRTVPFLMVDLR